MGRSIRLRKISAQVGDVVYHLGSLHFSSGCSLRAWQPAINAYRCEKHIAVCVDLAGVDIESVELLVEPRRLMLQGVRPAPSPPRGPRHCRKVITLEIESGEFCRQIEFPEPVDPDQVQARQENGLLWIILPVRADV